MTPSSPHTSQQDPCVFAERIHTNFASISGQTVFFDEAALLLHTLEGRMITSYAVVDENAAIQHDSENAACTTRETLAAAVSHNTSNTKEYSHHHYHTDVDELDDVDEIGDGFTAEILTPRNTAAAATTTTFSTHSPSEEHLISTPPPPPKTTTNKYSNTIPLLPLPSPSIFKHKKKEEQQQQQQQQQQEHQEMPFPTLDDEGRVVRAFVAREGPPITAVRCSLDMSITALQRHSKNHVECIVHSQHATPFKDTAPVADVATATAVGHSMFVVSPRAKAAAIFGCFWTDTPKAEFVLVTSLGIEAMTMVNHGHLVHSSTHTLSSLARWYVWSHQTRILIFGCGSAGSRLQMFQFSSKKVRTLPLLDLTPVWGTIPPSSSSSIQHTRNNTRSSHSHDHQHDNTNNTNTNSANSHNTEYAVHAQQPLQSSTLLSVLPTQIWAISLYQTIFVAYHDTSSTKCLRLYRIYEDATSLAMEIALHDHTIYSSIELSVIDNVLVIHYPQEGSAMLVDAAAAAVMTDGLKQSRHDVLCGWAMCPPGPLGMIFDTDRDRSEDQYELNRKQGTDGVTSDTVSHHATPIDMMDGTLELHGEDWAIDPVRGVVYKLKLDLEAIMISAWAARIPPAPNTHSANQEGTQDEGTQDEGAHVVPQSMLEVVTFLQRRRASAVPWRDPRRITLGLLDRLVTARAAPALLRDVFNALGAAIALAQHAQQSMLRSSLGHAAVAMDDGRESNFDALRVTRTVILPEEIITSILLPLFLSATSQTLSDVDFTLENANNMHGSNASTPPATLITDRTPMLLYIQATMSELIAACYRYHIKMPFTVAKFYLDITCALGRVDSLWSLLKSHAVLFDSLELATLLPSSLSWLPCDDSSENLERMQRVVGAYLQCAMRQRVGRQQFSQQF